MNPEIKAKWIEALRSGKYEQGQGKLNKNGKFCCLGVLCEVMNYGKLPSTYSGANSYKKENDTYESENHLTEGMRLELGIDSSQEHTLILMNDGKRRVENKKSFNEIADWVEKNL